MTRSVGSTLPEPLYRLLDGAAVTDQAGANPTFLLVTTGAGGWPHIAMLSVGEILARGPDELRVALWLHSTTTRTLERARQALLAVVASPDAYYVRLSAARLADLDLGAQGRLACFALRVEDVLQDAADYAALTSGITFRLHQPEQVVPRWERTIDALRAAA